MPLQLEVLSARRLTELPRENTVFFFPVGPYEDHGPHLPLSLDVLEAERLCHLCGERLERELAGWTAVVMPRAPIGINSSTSGISFTTRAHVLRDWLVDFSEPLVRAGFRHFVCFSGELGPRQLTAIEEAGKMLRRRHGGTWIGKSLLRKRPPTFSSASSALVSSEQVFSSPLWSDPREHAGGRDTSVALAIAPELVDGDYAALPEQRAPATYAERALARSRKQLSGYWGDPSKARKDNGERLLDETVREVFPKLRAVWEGSNPEKVFRSWYSIFPPNRSFFKAWLLALLLGLLLSVWFYLSLVAFT